MEICIRTLLGDKSSRPVEVSAAGWNKQQGDEGGFIVKLVLEVIRKGGCWVAHHPIDAFCMERDPDFRDSMQSALLQQRQILIFHVCEKTCTIFIYAPLFLTFFS